MKPINLILGAALLFLAYMLWRKSQPVTTKPATLDMYAPDGTLSDQVVEDMTPANVLMAKIKPQTTTINVGGSTKEVSADWQKSNRAELDKMSQIFAAGPAKEDRWELPVMT